ncbi:MAG: hypothetical protein WBE26_09685, partial [Phycisphaerae bacterium]
MTTVPPLDIKTVYSALKRHRRRKPGLYGRGSVRHSRLVLLGMLNLIVAGGLYYGTWWQVDKFLYLKLMLNTPLPIGDIEAPSSFLVPNLTDAPKTQPSPKIEGDPTTLPRFTGQTAQVILWVSAYGWLSLAVIANCALALAAGSSLGRSGGSTWRVFGFIFLIAAVAGLAWIGHEQWVRYGTEYPPDYWRAFMAGPVLVCVLLGLATGRGTRRWTYVASIMLILSAIGSVVGLYLGSQCGAIKPAELPVSFLPFLAIVFVIHSVWG